ncbi:DUF1178 family protein [Pararhodospirillum photometricum]|uniref:Uncharacterized protein n=1 Tax=Pararhodospirillum photometricum DSM 122 TaxID=1150469 RepID=H6SLZ0_PARPM|nr:DUF1178 family protein [Pararhodospirillum photometricum]CCG09005.1 Putative uncharacterized protein [Pararhodospirillum photometricum DSM 122]
MIRYSLECPDEHVFEHWFDSIADADAQLAAHAITCPECGATTVRKSLMAPNIGASKPSAPALPSCASASCCAGSCPALAG